MSYLDRARVRAKARLASSWTIPLRLLSFALMAGFTHLALRYLMGLHLSRCASHEPEHFAGLGFFLMAFGPFLASIPLGFIAANLIAYAVPPVRRSLDQVANYRQAQRELFRLALVIVPPGLVLGVVGALYLS